MSEVRWAWVGDTVEDLRIWGFHNNNNLLNIIFIDRQRRREPERGKQASRRINLGKMQIVIIAATKGCPPLRIPLSPKSSFDAHWFSMMLSRTGLRSQCPVSVCQCVISHFPDIHTATQHKFPLPTTPGHLQIFYLILSLLSLLSLYDTSLIWYDILIGRIIYHTWKMKDERWKNYEFMNLWYGYDTSTIHHPLSALHFIVSFVDSLSSSLQS